jgi:hypothetical protein
VPDGTLTTTLGDRCHIHLHKGWLKMSIKYITFTAECASVKVRYCLSLLIFTVGAMLANDGDAQTKSNPAYDEISSFADRICGVENGSDEQKGTSTTLELSASVKADLSQLVRKLIGLGIEVKGSGSMAQYEGILQSDLPKIRKDRQTCKIEVVRMVLKRSGSTATTGNIAYLKSTTIPFVNMGIVRGLDHIGFAKSMKEPQPTNTINGVGVTIADLIFDQSRQVESIKLIVSPPNEAPITRTIPIGAPIQISTQVCRQIFVTADRVQFANDSGAASSDKSLADKPTFDSNGDVFCSTELSTCHVWVSVQGECTSGFGG